MGPRREGEPSAGRESKRPATQPLSRRLTRFVDRFPHLHTVSGIIAAVGLSTLPLATTPSAYAEGQPGVKPQAIEAAGVQADPPAGEDTFSPDQPNNQPRIEFVDGVPTVYVPQERVEVAGVLVGGKPPVDAEQPDPDSPDAGAAEAPTNALELNYTSPKGFLTIDNSYPEDPAKQPTDGFKPSDPKSESGGDDFLEKYGIHVQFVRNTSIKTARLGSTSIYLDPEGRQRFAVLRPIVNPETKTITMEYNYLMPDTKVTPEFLAEHSRYLGGTIGDAMAKIVYGKLVDEAESQEEANKLAQLMFRLNEITPVQMVAPTI